MESEPLKVLLAGADGRFARDLAGTLGKTGGTIEVATFEAAISTLKKNPFHAVLFEPPSVNAAALFQITSLAVQAPRVAVIVLGSAADGEFAMEVVSAGAQDYLAKEEFEPHLLQRTIRCAMERQQERTALIQEKDNYYGVF